MTEILIEKSENISIDSNKETLSDLSLIIKERTFGNVIITMEGDRPLTLNLNVKVEASSNIRLMVINHLNEHVTINETYHIARDSEVLAAHAELNQYGAEINSQYELDEEGAKLIVQTASLSGEHKVFNQSCYHHAGHTEAHINNYGVVWANGHSELIVKNTIDKGSHNASTHQTSRLLTYDKSSKGRILPVLYIYDNEVQASHAASLGQPDDEQIYYLQSRGLSHNEAVQLIVKGYLLPITKVISDSELEKLLADEIETKVQEACSK